MKDLHAEVLRPRTPQQTYLEERLQSARWLGWATPTHVAAVEARTNESAQAVFVSPAQGSPA